MSGESAWYASGLRFACTQCGNCCRNHGEYAYVNLGPRELEEIPRFLGISPQEFLQRHCSKEPGHFPTLRMDEPHCPFLDGQSRCAIYSVRPLQCRTWPFWRSNLEQKAWEGPVSECCPGIGNGPLYPEQEIDARAAATDQNFA